MYIGSDFPYFHDFFTLSHASTAFISWHCHDEFELIIIKNGTLKLNMNLQKVVLQKGDICFINSNTLHSMELEQEEICDFYQISFHPSLIYGDKLSSIYLKYIKSFIEQEQLSGLLFSENICWQKEVKTLILKCFSCYEKKESGYEFLIRSYLSSIFYEFVKYGFCSTDKKDDSWNKDICRVKQMMNFMKQQYKKQLTIDEIAAHGKIHRRECFRAFQRVLGISPIQYLLQYRLEMAAHLLRATDFPISKISQEVGIQSPSYFTKMFKEKMLRTPYQYRHKK